MICHTSFHSPWRDSSVSSPESPACPLPPSSSPGCPHRLSDNSPAPPSLVCRLRPRLRLCCLRPRCWGYIYSSLIKSLPPSATSCCPGSLSTCPLRDPMVGLESSLQRLQPPTSPLQVRRNKTKISTKKSKNRSNWTQQRSASPRNVVKHSHVSSSMWLFRKRCAFLVRSQGGTRDPAARKKKALQAPLTPFRMFLLQRLTKGRACVLFRVYVSSHTCVVQSCFTERRVSQLQETNSRNLTASSEKRDVIGQEETRVGFWNHKLTWQADRRINQSTTGTASDERRGPLMRRCRASKKMGFIRSGKVVFHSQANV